MAVHHSARYEEAKSLEFGSLFGIGFTRHTRMAHAHILQSLVKTSLVAPHAPVCFKPQAKENNGKKKERNIAPPTKIQHNN